MATSPDGLSRSWQSQGLEVFQRGYRLLVDRSDVLDVEKDRANMDAVAGTFRSIGPIAWSPVSADGIPAEWLVPVGIPPQRTVLYIHGGAFNVGSLEGARAAAGNIAVAGKARVLSIDYRLAPEYPFPAALEDVLVAYRWILATRVKPETIVVVGESAGGTLALGLLLQLRDQGTPLPGLAVCLSPLTDLAMSGDTWEFNAGRDLLLHPEKVRASIELYLAGADPVTPLASPLYAELAGLPPMLIHVGSEEYLLSDATRLADKAKAAGVVVRLEVWDHMQHGWHIMAPFLPEARAALAGVGEFMEKIP
jgi:monoterpene epsilon-lactone hydrolase